MHAVHVASSVQVLQVALQAAQVPVLVDGNVAVGHALAATQVSRSKNVMELHRHRHRHKEIKGKRKTRLLAANIKLTLPLGQFTGKKSTNWCNCLLKGRCKWSNLHCTSRTCCRRCWRTFRYCSHLRPRTMHQTSKCRSSYSPKETKPMLAN